MGILIWKLRNLNTKYKILKIEVKGIHFKSKNYMILKKKLDLKAIYNNTL